MERKDDQELLSSIMQKLEEFYSNLPMPQRLAGMLGSCEKILYGMMQTTIDCLSDAETRSERTQSLIQMHIRGLRENFPSDASHAIFTSYVQSPLDPQTPKMNPDFEKKLKYANKILNEVLDNYNKKHGGK